MKRVNEIFKPKKVTLNGKVKIVTTDSGNYVIKPKNNDIPSLYTYLRNRYFSNYPELIDEYDDNYVFDYLESVKLPINQKATDMALLLANLHQKTAYFKPIVLDHIKEIYENILNNILHIEDYYEKLFKKMETEEFMQPSSYLLIRNRSLVYSLIVYLKKEIESWYKIANELTKERVVYCHNNLTIDHFIKGETDAFISWDNYTIDSPVLDLLNLYHNDHSKYDFSNFLDTYLNKFTLLDEEKKLLFITLSIPPKANFNDNELENTINVGKMIDYIINTEKLIRPHYQLNKTN